MPAFSRLVRTLGGVVNEAEDAVRQGRRVAQESRETARSAREAARHADETASRTWNQRAAEEGFYLHPGEAVMRNIEGADPDADLFARNRRDGDLGELVAPLGEMLQGRRASGEIVYQNVEDEPTWIRPRDEGGIVAKNSRGERWRWNEGAIDVQNDRIAEPAQSGGPGSRVLFDESSLRTHPNRVSKEKVRARALQTGVRGARLGATPVAAYGGQRAQEEAEQRGWIDDYPDVNELDQIAGEAVTRRIERATPSNIEGFLRGLEARGPRNLPV